MGATLLGTDLALTGQRRAVSPMAWAKHQMGSVFVDFQRTFRKIHDKHARLLSTGITAANTPVRSIIKSLFKASRSNNRQRSLFASQATVFLAPVSARARPGGMAPRGLAHDLTPLKTAGRGELQRSCGASRLRVAMPTGLRG